MSKPTNPYTTLKNEAAAWARNVIYPHTRGMFSYPKSGGPWNLTDLRERVAAADQLGYDVKLRVTDDSLVVEYAKRPPPAPWSFRP